MRPLICIIDDDKSVTRALGRLVHSFGFEVRLLASGRECLNSAYIDQAACLIVDVFMPGIDGFELHDLLQASNRNIPTIFISAHDDIDYKAKAESIDCACFLSKPCDEADLMGAIDQVLAA